MSGIARIALERTRQVNAEGWTSKHDDGHLGGELAMAAATYAAPRSIFIEDAGVVGVDAFNPAWPRGWGLPKFVGRPRPTKFGDLPPEQTDEDRIRELVKAGALIAAEIDRIERSMAREAHGRKA